MDLRVKMAKLGKTRKCKLCNADIKVNHLLEHSKRCYEIKELESALDQVNYWLLSKCHEAIKRKNKIGFDTLTKQMKSQHKKKTTNANDNQQKQDGSQSRTYNQSRVDYVPKQVLLARKMYKNRKCATHYSSNSSSNSSLNYYDKEKEKAAFKEYVELKTKVKEGGKPLRMTSFGQEHQKNMHKGKKKGTKSNKRKMDGEKEQNSAKLKATFADEGDDGAVVQAVDSDSRRVGDDDSSPAENNGRDSGGSSGHNAKKKALRTQKTFLGVEGALQEPPGFLEEIDISDEDGSPSGEGGHSKHVCRDHDHDHDHDHEHGHFHHHFHDHEEEIRRRSYQPGENRSIASREGSNFLRAAETTKNGNNDQNSNSNFLDDRDENPGLVTSIMGSKIQKRRVDIQRDSPGATRNRPNKKNPSPQRRNQKTHPVKTNTNKTPPDDPDLLEGPQVKKTNNTKNFVKQKRKDFKKKSKKKESSSFYIGSTQKQDGSSYNSAEFQREIDMLVLAKDMYNKVIKYCNQLPKNWNGKNFGFDSNFLVDFRKLNKAMQIEEVNEFAEEFMKMVEERRDLIIEINVSDFLHISPQF